MNSYKPLISIIVPVYNKEDYIIECINSLLEQSYKNIEILIYDDLSTDSSLKKLEIFIDDRIFIYRGAVNKGVKYGRDFLLQKANGDFISFFDADDVCHKNKYIKILNHFNQNPDIDIIGSRVKYINSKGIELFKPFTFESYSKEDIKANLFFCNTISTSTVVLKRKVINKISFQEFKYAIGEDYYVWIKLSHFYNFINLPDKLITYRVTDHGMMGNTKLVYPDAISFIHAYQFEYLNLPANKSIINIHNKFMYDDFITKYYILRSLIFYKTLFSNVNDFYNKKSFSKQIRINWLRKCIIYSKNNPIESLYIYLFYFKNHNLYSILKVYILIIYSIKYFSNNFLHVKK